MLFLVDIIMSFSTLNNSASSFGSFGDFGVYDKIYVPSNKESAWVYPKGSDNVTNERSKTHQGMWQMSEFCLKNLTEPVGRHNKTRNLTTASTAGEEVWIFRDDDELGIDKRVLQNNPLQGRWGYAPSVKKKIRGRKVIIMQKVIDVQDMWFFPPDTTNFPKNCDLMGDWVKPEKAKRNMDMLQEGTSGFIAVPDTHIAPSVVSGTAHSGRWKMLGHNEVRKKVVPKKKKGPPTLDPPETPTKQQRTSNRSVVAETPTKSNKSKLSSFFGGGKKKSDSSSTGSSPKTTTSKKPSSSTQMTSPTHKTKKPPAVEAAAVAQQLQSQQ